MYPLRTTITKFKFTRKFSINAKTKKKKRRKDSEYFYYRLYQIINSITCNPVLVK